MSLSFSQVLEKFSHEFYKPTIQPGIRHTIDKESDASLLSVDQVINNDPAIWENREFVAATSLPKKLVLSNFLQLRPDLADDAVLFPILYEFLQNGFELYAYSENEQLLPIEIKKIRDNGYLRQLIQQMEPVSQKNLIDLWVAKGLNPEDYCFLEDHLLEKIRYELASREAQKEFSYKITATAKNWEELEEQELWQGSHQAIEADKVSELSINMSHSSFQGKKDLFLAKFPALTSLSIACGGGLFDLSRYQQQLHKLSLTPGVQLMSGLVLKNLKELTASAVQIAAFNPSCLANLEVLEIVDSSDLLLLPHLPRLKKLILPPGIKEFPNLSHLQHLEELVLPALTPAKTIDTSLLPPNLKKLTATGVAIKNLSHLQHLEELDITLTEESVLPIFLPNLKKLKVAAPDKLELPNLSANKNLKEIKILVPRTVKSGCPPHIEKEFIALKIAAYPPNIEKIDIHVVSRSFIPLDFSPYPCLQELRLHGTDVESQCTLTIILPSSLKILSLDAIDASESFIDFSTCCDLKELYLTSYDPFPSLDAMPAKVEVLGCYSDSLEYGMPIYDFARFPLLKKLIVHRGIFDRCKGFSPVTDFSYYTDESCSLADVEYSIPSDDLSKTKPYPPSTPAENYLETYTDPKKTYDLTWLMFEIDEKQKLKPVEPPDIRGWVLIEESASKPTDFLEEKDCHIRRVKGYAETGRAKWQRGDGFFQTTLQPSNAWQPLPLRSAIDSITSIHAPHNSKIRYNTRLRCYEILYPITASASPFLLQYRLRYNAKLMPVLPPKQATRVLPRDEFEVIKTLFQTDYSTDPNVSPVFRTMQAAWRQLFTTRSPTLQQKLTFCRTALTEYCNAFSNAELSGKFTSLPPWARTLLEAKGSCWHRTHAFSRIARAIGVPVQVIRNECHRYVEIFNETGWEKLELGGAATEDKRIGKTTIQWKHSFRKPVPAATPESKLWEADFSAAQDLGQATSLSVLLSHLSELQPIPPC